MTYEHYIIIIILVVQHSYSVKVLWDMNKDIKQSERIQAEMLRLIDKISTTLTNIK